MVAQLALDRPWLLLGCSRPYAQYNKCAGLMHFMYTLTVAI